MKGPNAYGFLKGENGVHRLVRVSPFDCQRPAADLLCGAVEVIPEIDDDSQ